MKCDNVVALSLFSGIGGFEVGMARCGFRFLKTLEWDEKCCETLNKNKPLLGTIETEIKPIDITQTPPQDFYSKSVDYIVGGPPCQSFSAAGRRAGGVSGTNDLRGSLFEYYCKYVDYFKPKAFVFENVRGILSANKGNDFQMIVKSFEEVGYNIFWRILNAADYGAPQLRERVFLVGIRNDLNIDFKFPMPTYGEDSPNKTKYVTTFEAIEDLQNDSEIVKPYGGKYGDLIPDIPPGENYRFYTEEMGHPNPQFAWRSKFSNFLYKMDPNDVCRTIIAYQGRYDGPFHWKNRKCTVAELQRLQGFPKEFVIEQSYQEGVKQIGNSVCPLVAEQIGKALLYQIEGKEEFEIPLISKGQKLSFDKRKGDTAKKSRAKKVVAYKDINQLTFFDCSDEEKQSYCDFSKARTNGKYKYLWNFTNGHLLIKIYNDNGRKKAAELDLVFMGNVKSSFNETTVILFSDNWSEDFIRIMWDEVHSSVRELSSYDSLMPLYGHFTEPYPKFTISFKSNYDSEVINFQKMALNPQYSNRILSYEQISSDYNMLSDQFKRMREIGYDVRTHNTNKTIPEAHFRICYPFTMPNTLKSNIIWKD